MEFDKEGIEASIDRFEQMLERDEVYFFDVDEFDRIAEHYLEKGDRKTALRTLRVATSQHPDHPTLLLRKAQVKAAAGNLDDALDLLNEVEAMEPFNADVLLMQASIHGQLRNYELSISYYEKALLHTEEYTEDILIDMAFEYENAERYEEAIATLRHALDHDPANEAAIYELAHVYELSGRVKESIETYKELIDRSPYSYTAWYNLGNAHIKLGEYKKALEAYGFCLVIKEDFSSAYFNKANAHAQLEQYDRAAEAYMECIKLEGAMPVTHCYLGECYEKMERYQVALRHYQKALELDPEWADAWIGIGVVKDLQGTTLESLNYFRKAVSLNDKDADSWLILAKALHRAEHYLEAKQAFEKTAELSPDNKELWSEYSSMELEFVSPANAIEIVQRGLDVYDDQPELKYQLTAYLLREGKMEEALEKLEEALTLSYEDHSNLFDHYPESRYIPQVVELIELYKDQP